MHTKSHTQESRRKISLSNTGNLSSQWKGDRAKYQALHGWIRRHHGQADRCENPLCEGKSKQYQWALKPGRKYSRNIGDYVRLCRSCHRLMDFTEETREKMRKGSTKFVGCKIKECGRVHLCRGYCQYHYNTLVRRGLVDKLL